MPIKQKLVCACALFGLLAGQGLHAQNKELVDYVNPYIGNISRLLVPAFATVQLPNNMLRMYPERGDYTAELVNGLPVIVTNHRERSAFNISPYRGKQPTAIVPLNYDHEKLTPYGFDIELDDNQVKARYAVSHQSAVYGLNFWRKNKPVYVMINSRDDGMHCPGNAVSGFQRLTDQTKVYICAEVGRSPMRVGALENNAINASKASVEGRNACIALRCAGGTPQVRLRYDVSFLSEEQAKKDLKREIQHFDVDVVAAKDRRIWNDALANIQVKGGSEDQKTVLYTSYYRTFEHPICYSEDGKCWSTYDGAVHEDGGIPFYTDDWIWGTYRAAHPLRVLIQPEKEENVIESYLRMAEQMGTLWVPTFPEVAGDSRRMDSNHGIAMVADALYKGLKVDAKHGYEYSRKALEEKTLAPWSDNPAGWIDDFYEQHGYIPALREGEKKTDPNVSDFEKYQPVAVTLGTAYDEWCLSRIASYLNKNKEASYYEHRERNYRTLFSHGTSFFRPKDKEDNFLQPFDYRFSGGVGARDAYDENSGWTCRWDVQHNVADLINLMDGREQFVKNLDQTFIEPMGRGKREFYTQLPDQTGSIGQFTMANEPSLHIPYLYNYTGTPWKTQKQIRQVLNTWFRNDLMGVPGDENGRGLASFVVFSSIGFYPVTPGIPAYNIGSPLFSDIQVRLGNGKIFHIITNNCSDENKYIQRATLNGKAWNKPWFSHDDIKNGGTLILEIGKRPNKSWGADKKMAPPSLDAKQ